MCTASGFSEQALFFPIKTVSSFARKVTANASAWLKQASRLLTPCIAAHQNPASEMVSDLHVFSCRVGLFSGALILLE